MPNTDDVNAFVTSNHKDFSLPNGDHWLPHADVADLFDGARSSYICQVEGLHELLVDQMGTYPKPSRYVPAPALSPHAAGDS